MAEDASAAAAVDGVDLSLGGWMSALADFPAATGEPIPVRVSRRRAVVVGVDDG
jgi:hypothetical protein